MSGHRDKHERDGRGRTEPTLGDISQVDEPVRAPSSDGLPQVTVEPREARAAPRKAPPRRRHGLVWLLLLILGAVVVAAWVNQGALRSLLPRTELNDVLGRAQQALQDGRLDGHDGSSARELFQAAVALEPDNDIARQGLHNVGRAELAQADAALQAGQIDQAAQQAAVARELLGGGSDMDRLDQAIEKIRATKLQADDVIDGAQQAYAAGRLEGEDGAGNLYKKVLRAQPGNAVAAHGLTQVGDALAQQASQAFAANDAGRGDVLISELAALQPNNSALPGLRAQQAQQRQQDHRALDEALQQGMAALAAGRISGAGDDTALTHFKAALALDPDNPQARAGLGKVAQALTVQASAAIDAGDTAEADQLLQQAAVLAPKSADLVAMRARMHGRPETTAPVASNDGVAAQAEATLSPSQQVELDQLVQRAGAAATRGDIMMPPGDSAYDLYRSALAIDGNNAAARQGLQGLPVQVERQFKQALAGGQLGRANDMLANLVELSPGDPAQTTLGNQLAEAYLDQAEQQLAGNDRTGATLSLNRARKLAPVNSRVQDLAVRLQGGM